MTMSPKAAAAAELITAAEMLPESLIKMAQASEDLLGRRGALHDHLAVWVLQKQAAAEGLGPAQDYQNVPAADQRSQGALEPEKPVGDPQASLRALMGNPDVQKWFRGSVGGLAKRGNIPYALLSPDQEIQTNMAQEQLRDILMKYQAQHGG